MEKMNITKLYPHNFDVSAHILEPFEKPKADLPMWAFRELVPTSKRQRGQETYKHVNALILDYDKDKTIEEFKSEFSHFFFYLYTTSSHTKEFPKFKVILPLLEPISWGRYASSDFKEVICRFFKGIDQSTLINFHYLPNLPKNKDDYDYFFNQVDRFFCEEDLTPIFNTIKRERKSDEIYKSMKTDKKNYNTQSNMSEESKIKYRQKVSENINTEFFKIPNFTTGDRYNQLKTITVKLIHLKFPDEQYIYNFDDIWGLIKQNCNNNTTKKMVESLFQKIRGYRC